MKKKSCNQLALARKVFERNIRSCQSKTVNDILQSELHERIEFAIHNLMLLVQTCSDAQNSVKRTPLRYSVNAHVVATMRERLAGVVRAVKAYCTMAEAVDAALVADTETGSEAT